MHYPVVEPERAFTYRTYSFPGIGVTVFVPEGIDILCHPQWFYVKQALPLVRCSPFVRLPRGP